MKSQLRPKPRKKSYQNPLVRETKILKFAKKLGIPESTEEYRAFIQAAWLLDCFSWRGKKIDMRGDVK